MRKNNIYIGLLLGGSSLFQAQPTDAISSSKEGEEKHLEERIVSDVELPEVMVYPKKNFWHREPVNVDKYYYHLLQQQVYNVYPYAQTAASLYRQTLEELDKIETKREKRRYIRDKIKILEGEYEKQLRKLSKKEGQIFSKLVNRQTKKTTYEIIRQLRSGWSAFWWNLKANIYDISLKTHYDPENNPEDHFIELILQQSFHSGKLLP